VSERKKNVAPLDKSFFKKTYKTKTSLPACDSDNKKDCQMDLEIPQPEKVFEKYAHILFPALPPERRQTKAMQNYRAKKLKKMFQTELELEEAVTRHKAQGLNLLLLQQFKQIVPNRKSIYATARARDAHGRFNNTSVLSKPHSSQYSTVDMRDDCNTENQTTVGGSFLSFLSFNNPTEVCIKQNNFDFDCMHEVSRQAPRSLGTSLPVQINNHIASKKESESISEQLPSLNVITSSVAPERSINQPVMHLRDVGRDLQEESSSYSHYLCGVFNGLMEDDLVSLTDYLRSE
jgi:hypothetical protein